MSVALSLTFPDNRDLDCITLGRANVDLYPPDTETLDTARTYHVFVGGSPANIAAGMARHNLKIGIISRVADDKHGRFVSNYLSQKFGIDVSHVQYDDSGVSTSLAFAECRPDAATIMYRNNVADLHITPSHIDEAYIAQAKAIFVSGTAFTQSPSREAMFTALAYAKQKDVRTIMDIDYRPYGWESMEEASQILMSAASFCDMVIGTREEFEISGISKEVSDEACATELLDQFASLVIIKRGSEGSFCAYRDRSGEILTEQGQAFSVDMKKPYGAGDAFASTFLSYLIKDKEVSHALKAAAAAASLNILGDSCTEAMPTEQEIAQFILEKEH